MEYFTSKIKDVIKILRERPDGDDTEILDLLYNKKISVGDALLSGRVNNLHINLNDMIREFLKSKCRTNTMAMAVDVSLFDPTYLSGRSRLKYRSKNKGNMYMDLFAFDKLSNSYVSEDMREVKERLEWTGEKFILAFDDVADSIEKKRDPRLDDKEFLRKFITNETDLEKFNSGKLYAVDKKDMEKLRDKTGKKVKRIADAYMNKYFKDILKERIELKLSKLDEDSKKLSLENLKVQKPFQPASELSLVPAKFFYRLPKNHQLRVELFVDQINNGEIDTDKLNSIEESRWYKKEQLPEIDFYGFWDGLYLEASHNGNLSKEVVNRVWEESKNRRYTPVSIKKDSLEEKLEDSTASKLIGEKITPYVDRKHPDYTKEKVEIVNLLSKGHSIEEIKKLKPHVKPQAVSGITAWHRHRDSWEK